MKLFLATAITAVSVVPVGTLRHPVALYFTSDEEVGCVGAKKLVKEANFKVAPHVVIGEPTELVPINMHKGYLYFQVKVWRQLRDKEKEKVRQRKVMHSSDDRSSTNVVEIALPAVINALSEFRNQMKSRYADERFSPPYPTMNVGGVIRMSGQSAKNVIPASFTVENDFRLLPGQESQDILNYLQRKLDQVVRNLRPEVNGEEIAVNVSAVRQPTPPMLTSPDSRLAQAAAELSGKTPRSVSYNTEGGVFNQHGAETVIWGPGSIAQAHKPDEFVEQKWLKPDITDRYIQLIRRLCC